jgi:hypothetical protein
MYFVKITRGCSCSDIYSLLVTCMLTQKWATSGKVACLKYACVWCLGICGKLCPEYSEQCNVVTFIS